MWVVRPITLADLDAFEEMAAISSGGITTLPNDRVKLHELILRSEQAFSLPPDPNGNIYLFVLEEIISQRVLGCSALYSRADALSVPLVYQIQQMPIHSTQLSRHTHVPTLQLQEMAQETSKLATLFVMPEARKGGAGRLLSLSRFLFLAAHPSRFAPIITAELRGKLTKEGHSPFWDWICRPFFGIDLSEAYTQLYESAAFVSDLMPRHPLYIPLLPNRIQELIGKTHPNTLPAKHMLEQEGLAFHKTIDIFDGGPHIHANTNQLRIVKERKTATIAKVQKVSAPTQLLSSLSLTSFRCCLAPIAIDHKEVTLGLKVADALGVDQDHTIAYVSPHGTIGVTQSRRR